MHHCTIQNNRYIRTCKHLDEGLGRYSTNVDKGRDTNELHVPKIAQRRKHSRHTHTDRQTDTQTHAHTLSA